MSQHPILWSFRRCPYAMRARLAIMSSGIKVELREILLRDKPPAFLETSPSATVPALRVNGRVLDESADIMVWALEQSDPQRLLEMPNEGWSLIDTNDGPFKTALDHTKYASRFPELDAGDERAKAAAFLADLDQRLKGQNSLFGHHPTIADQSILPFVRQFANTEREWFDAQPWPDLISWLNRFTESAAFAEIMTKYVPWSEGDAPHWFGR
jgi:glutathione S-transferase